MEKGKVPLTAQTWRPILLCGLLLASKVWQDYASWNIEFSHVYPQVRSSLTALVCSHTIRTVSRPSVRALPPPPDRDPYPHRDPGPGAETSSR